jgi:hypothetical protein
MSITTKPNHRFIVWTDDEPLAMALAAREHSIFSVYINKDTNRTDWWFNSTASLGEDIAKYVAGELEVNAQLHHQILKGVNEEWQLSQAAAEITSE